MGNVTYINREGKKFELPEEIVKELRRMDNTWAKKESRKMRCMGKGGNRCAEDCTICPKYPSCGLLSLDALYDDIEWEPEYSGKLMYRTEDAAVDKILLEHIDSFLLDRFDDRDRRIFWMTYGGATERQIAESLNISQPAVNKRLKKIRELLSEEFKSIRD